MQGCSAGAAEHGDRQAAETTAGGAGRAKCRICSSSHDLFRGPAFHLQQICAQDALIIFAAVMKDPVNGIVRMPVQIVLPVRHVGTFTLLYLFNLWGEHGERFGGCGEFGQDDVWKLDACHLLVLIQKAQSTEQSSSNPTVFTDEYARLSIYCCKLDR